jgi:hypothetical protein
MATPGIYTIQMVSTNSSGSVAATTQTVNIQSCNPLLSFTLPAVLDKCDPTARLRPGNTSTSPNGTNSYTWNIQPTSGVTPNTGTGINIVSNVTNTNITTYTVTLKATNASGTAAITQTVKVEFFNCTGIEENTLANVLSVYPNPAHDQISIKVPATYESFNVKITNIVGAVVFNEKVTNSAEAVNVSLANKPKGVYFLTVEATNEKTTKKIIIE